MKAAALTAPKTFAFIDQPKPHLQANQVLVKVRRVGICGSDLHFYSSGKIGDVVLQDPFVMGHEFMGEIADTNRLPQSPPMGTRVAIDPAVPCGKCVFCQTGRGNICPNVKFTGFPPYSGAFTDYIAIDIENVFALPDNITDIEGPVIETLAVAIHALEIMPDVKGKTCAVLGAGSVGMLVILLLLHHGANVVLVTEPVADRRKIAHTAGCDFVVSPDEHNAIHDYLKRTTEFGPELIFEAAGEPEAFQMALDIARPGGEICFIGIHPEGNMTLDLTSMRRKELRTVYCRRSLLSNYPTAIDLVANQHINIKPLITHEFSLDQIGKAFHLAHQRIDGIVKGVLEI
jgi:L-iditol 2-dehydrogenase